MHILIYQSRILSLPCGLVYLCKYTESNEEFAPVDFIVYVYKK